MSLVPVAMSVEPRVSLRMMFKIMLGIKFND